VLALVGVAGLVSALGGGTTSASRTGSPAHAAAPWKSAIAPTADGSYSASALGSPVNYTTGLAESPAPQAARTAASATSQAVSNGSTAATGQSALIEETGSVTLLVPGSAIQSDISRLMTVAVANGGFVAGTDTQSASPGSPAQGTVTIQVPEASFNSVLAQVQGFGKVESLSSQATDVTGQYVDLQAQISALEASRQQYLVIMTKATTVGNILAVQSQLDNLQSQLQELQGQLKVLTNETTYATLVVTLTQRTIVKPPPKPETGLAKAWHSAVSGFVAGCEGVVRVAGPLLFALLLVGALVLLGRLGWRARRRAQPVPAAEPETSDH
jgi:chaperonin cofactor prefoldin